MSHWASDLVEVIDSRILALVGDARPYRAVVTEVAASGMVKLRKPEAATAGTELYARVAGFVVAVADEVLCLDVAGRAVVLGIVQYAARSGYALDAPLTLSTALAVAQGGTGATSAGAALTALGAAPLASPTFTGTATIPTLAATTINAAGNSLLGDSQSDLTTITGKRATAGSAPSVAIGAAAGTGATVGTITGNDISGRVVLNTGTSPGTGTLCTVTYNTAYAATPNAIMVAQQAATGGTGDVYATSIAASSFVIGCRTAPTASSTITVGWAVD